MLKTTALLSFLLFEAAAATAAPSQVAVATAQHARAAYSEQVVDSL